MELTKIGVAKLTVVSVSAAVVCLACISLLGLSFTQYWRYVANEKAEQEHLSTLQQSITQMESAVAEKRMNVEKIDSENQKYVSLTNQNAEAEKVKQSATEEIQRKQEALKQLDIEQVTLQEKHKALLDVIAGNEKDLKKLKDEISEKEIEKSALSNITELVKQKQQELDGIKVTLSEKEAKSEKTGKALAEIEDRLREAQTNLASVIERAEGETEIISLKNETIESLRLQIEILNGRKAVLTTNVNELAGKEQEIEKTITKRGLLEKELTSRVVSLAEKYDIATNKLAESRLQLEKVAVEARRKLDAEIAQKEKEADERVDKAKMDLKEIENRSSKIVAEAKNDKARAEADAEIAKQKLRVLNEQITDEEGRLASIKKTIGENQANLVKLQSAVEQLQKQETSLTGSIATKISNDTPSERDSSESK